MPDQEVAASTEERRLPESERRPIRGSLRLDVSISTPLVTSGSDFSIFVTIQNPFDVPIEVVQVLTHIPVELSDIVGGNLRRLEKEKARPDRRSFLTNLTERIVQWSNKRERGSGAAIAIGTEFSSPVDSNAKVIIEAPGKVRVARSGHWETISRMRYLKLPHI
jgi:hypothetical protein